MIACVIIAGGNRTKLIDIVTLAIREEGFDEILVVGEHKAGKGYRYLHVPAMTKSTNDALIKRDVGALACHSDTILFLSDDHVPLSGFVAELQTLISDAVIPWDVLIPSRWVDHPEQGIIRIPNGEENRYCAGHGGVFRRRVIRDRPWTAQKHHPNWDLIASHDQQAAGFRFVSYPRLRIMDLEPENRPWL